MTAKSSVNARLQLLPAVDVSDGQAVRLTQGNSNSETQYGSAVEAARLWLDAGAEWIHLADLDAAFSRGHNREALAEVVANAGGAKVQLSGGIRDLAALETLLDLGAERIVLSTMALQDAEFVREAIEQHRELIAVGLDVRGDRLVARGQTAEGMLLAEALELLERFDCRRYVVTDVTRDGTLGGPNYELLSLVMSQTKKPVVASGGIASLNDIRELRSMVGDGLEGAILGKALYAKNFTIEQALETAGENDF
jgi:1-(5-phosphoribosyl)-5-[(5-phosphoribosylamino)methylideneamino] imidazole-4-carboxamide isomerase/N-(5'phosphoribosyl)anthranilate isomerase